jgi:hypothetical protein
MQSFLGFANFYRQYIHNYFDIVVPLTRLTQKNIPWNFDESCKLAFLTLKTGFHFCSGFNSLQTWLSIGD